MDARTPLCAAPDPEPYGSCPMSSVATEPLEIDGLILFRPKKFLDARGYFTETYNAGAYAEAGVGAPFVQDNQSLSLDAGTIRGLHFQTPPEPQAKLIRVIEGSIFDVGVDLRRGSPTYGRWCAVTLTAEAGEQLFVPRGFAHGFCTLEPNTIVAYKVDGYYAPDCDNGLKWDDPDLAISWPVDPARVIVSDKDAKLGYFRDLDTPFTL
jgi:dTDP-4-dehydrorhamnose 3,5-epimerase